MTATQSAQKKIDGILEQVAKEQAEIKDTIGGYQIQAQTAAATMETAGDACDLDAYNKAREDKRKAEGALEMYQRRADKLDNEPLITPEEYQSLCDGILQEVNTYFDNMESELFEVSRKLEDMNRAAAEKMSEANRVLHSLQYDIYRGADLKYVANGKYPERNTVKEAGTRYQWGLIDWSGRMTDSAIYQDLKKKRESAQ